MAADDKEKSAFELEAAVGPVKAKLSLTDLVFSGRAVQHRIRMGVADSIVEKIKKREALTDIELFFFASTFEKELKRTERVDAVIARAAELFPAVAKEMKMLPPPSGEDLPSPPEALLAPPPPGEQKETSPEFVARVLRDAEDASDDAVRDLYARVIAGEVVRPGSFSLRTLSVLRDLEISVAKKFEAATALLLCGRYLPHPSGISRPLYKSIGVTADDLQMLIESGLLTVEQYGVRSVSVGNKVELPLSDGVAAVQNNKNRLIVYGHSQSAHATKQDWKLDIHVQMLTAAGRELATIPAHITDMSILRQLAFWLARQTNTNGGWATVRWLSTDGEQEFDPPVVYPDPPASLRSDT